MAADDTPLCRSPHNPAAAADACGDFITAGSHRNRPWMSEAAPGVLSDRAAVCRDAATEAGLWRPRSAGLTPRHSVGGEQSVALSSGIR